MQYQTITRSAVATAATVLGAAAAVAKEKPALDKAAMDKALRPSRLSTGTSDTKSKLLGPLEDAVPAAHCDVAARKELETRSNT